MSDTTNDEIPLPSEEADDMSFLGDILDAATAETNENRRLRDARKRMVKLQKAARADSQTEKLALVEEIRGLEERRVWQTVGCVALFHHQVCSNCSTHHTSFVGWFIVRTSIKDPYLRDLIRGEPGVRSPRWAETEHRGCVPICADCVEEYFAARLAAGEYLTTDKES